MNKIDEVLSAVHQVLDQLLDDVEPDTLDNLVKLVYSKDTTIKALRAELGEMKIVAATKAFPEPDVFSTTIARGIL